MTKNTKKDSNLLRKDGSLLGIRLNGSHEDRVLRDIELRLKNRKQTLIFTPNPEIILRALGNSEYRQVLKKADINLIDGIGLTQAIKFLSLPAPKNKLLRGVTLLFQGTLVGVSTFVNKGWLYDEAKVIKGREFFIKLLRLANKKSYKVVLLGDTSTLTASKALTRSYKGVNITPLIGPRLNNRGETINEAEKEIQNLVLERIGQIKPDMLFVGFGAPKQEIWVNKFSSRLGVPVIMAVGGTFDYISDSRASAQRVFGNIGLEWLWRGLSQPSRLVRTISATIIFPVRIFLLKLRGK